MQKPVYVEVLLPLALENTLTYVVPKEINNTPKIGSRVIVELGKRKIYTGIITKIHSEKPDYECKEILSVKDDFPILSEKQTELLNWISDYYCCTQGETLAAAMPSKLLASSETQVWFNKNCESDYSPTQTEINILNYLENSPKASVSDIAKAVNLKNPLKHIENLEEQGFLNLSQQIVNAYKPKYQNFLSFNLDLAQEKLDEIEKILTKNNKQKEVLQFFNEKCLQENITSLEYSEKLLMQELNVAKSTIQTLVNKGLIEIVKKEETRFETINVESAKSLKLSEAQTEVYNQIKNNFGNSKPVLLHGVTSSGKTEIYIKLIKEVLKTGKQILYLLPEIALTTQMINRLRNYFGDKIGVFHSKYTVDARSEIYLKLLKKELQIVLGVRSAVLLPFSDLGLIIVDEEHETSFKQQDPDPRYSARDTAVVLSKLHKAEIVLGSATPSIESYNNAINSKYLLTTLNQRYGNVEMPEIVLADMSDAYKRKINSGHFHPILINEIKKVLEKNQQVILFQNRRGYTSIIECRDCGWVPHCKSCNVSLTYHKFRNKLVCHYCGEMYDIVNNCGNCNSEKLSHKGFGTEKLEDEVSKFFPHARIARLDYDTASTRNKFSRIIAGFEKHEFDILVGTQMVTKGLDFQKLALVGVLNADNLLNYPEFRAYERAFQLLTQVSGRAGRRDKRGKVIIQTYDVLNPIIQYVKNEDYLSMFNSQLAERQLFNYPPFSNYIIIKLKHKDRAKVHRTADVFAMMLRTKLGNRVRGPEEPLINKISNYFILNVHIRFEKTISGTQLRKFIKNRIAKIKEESDFSSVRFEIDVDP